MSGAPKALCFRLLNLFHGKHGASSRHFKPLQPFVLRGAAWLKLVMVSEITVMEHLHCRTAGSVPRSVELAVVFV